MVSFFTLVEILMLTFSCIFSDSAKIARLKQAKEEAEKDIAAFRAHMEAEFQRKLAEVRMLKEITDIILLWWIGAGRRFLLNSVSW